MSVEQRTRDFVHPFSPPGRTDPYSALAWLRENDPVHDDAMTGMFLVTRHADVSTILRDRRFSAAGGQQARAREDALPPSMLTTDPPEHDRLRAPGVAVVGPSVVRGLTAGLEAEAERAVGALPAGGTVDLVAGLAEPYALGVLARTVGVPDAERARFGEIAARASVNLDPMAARQRAADAARAAQDLHAFLDAVTPATPVTPDGALARDEWIGVLSLSVVGGLEPLAHAVVTTALFLLQRPELREQPMEDLLGEAIRLESPIPFTARQAVEDMTLSGVRVPAGARVLAFLSAANRDPRAYDDPDALLPGRTGPAALAFGAGAHYCLGAHLVRRAGATLLEALLAAVPDLRAARPDQLAAPPWADAMVPRGLVSLEVALG